MPLLTAVLLVGNHLLCQVPSPALPESPSLLVQAEMHLCQSVSGEFTTVTVTLLSVGTIADATLNSTVPATFVVGERRAGRVPVAASWVTSKGYQQQSVLWFRVNGKGSAWQFRHDIASESMIAAGDVELVEVDLAALDLTPAQASNNPIGLALSKSVRKGQVALPGWLREPALVQRNEAIRVVVAQPGLRVVTRGIALTTGWGINDRVQVSVAGAQQTVLAKVAGKDEVYVEI